MIRAIFFDAGGTLVFPTRERTLAPLAQAGFAATAEQLFAAERTARRRRDRAAAEGVSLRDAEYWRIYYGHLLAEVGCADARVCDALMAAASRSGNWESIQAGTREALLRLKPRYRLGVISNSDGHIADLFARLGLGDCFHSFTDSGQVGFEKPDTRIFLAAAESLGVAAKASLYVGDIYSVDYLGAQAAGMQPLLFDPSGTYRETGLPRVESLEELVKRLGS